MRLNFLALGGASCAPPSSSALSVLVHAPCEPSLTRLSHKPLQISAPRTTNTSRALRAGTGLLSILMSRAAPLVLPANAAAAKTLPATVIFLHGLGDTGRGWASAAVSWQKLMPHVKFVLP